MLKHLLVVSALLGKLALFAVVSQPSTSADCPWCPWPPCFPGDVCDC